MGKKPREKLSAAELDVLKAIWKLPEATVPALVDELNARRSGEPLTRGTIQVLLTRLEEKGWVDREKAGRAFLYAARVPEDEGLAELTADFREKVFDGSSLALVQCLVRGGLAKSEVAELRRMLDEAERSLGGRAK